MKKQWWHDKVAYQIYPKSFFDSNGDGIGDLPGILSKLDYLKDLGVDILWLSPVYRSPLADQGYDISDYYDIDPRFGTMEDMERLLAEAKKRDMYIVMDLVVNHCSDEHEWFQKACADPEGPYGQFFYIRKLPKAQDFEGSSAPIGKVPAASVSYKSAQAPSGRVPASSDFPEDACVCSPFNAGSGKSDNAVPGCLSDSDCAVCSPDGHILPCNWRSHFGGQVWHPLPGQLPGHEDYYYLHVFHKKQPDLNWENPALREEIFKMINWWLDKGLAGFRIDAIMNIKKVLPFKNYAPDRDDGLCDIGRMLHEAAGIGRFLGEMRDRAFAPHGAFTVGEVFNGKDSELPSFIGDNGYFSTIFDFSETVWGSSPAGWHASLDITPDSYRQCLFETQKKTAGIGFISNIIENHDEPRGVSRYIPEEDRQDAPRLHRERRRIEQTKMTGRPSLAAEPDTTDADDNCPSRSAEPGRHSCLAEPGSPGADDLLYLTAKKALATVYFFSKGLPWIYQGQEIGMENIPLDNIGEVDDVASLDAWNVMRGLGLSETDCLRAVEKYGRDNARTPFQWSDAPGAGFTTGTPWLRVNPNYRRVNLAAQKDDPASVFSHYRKMIALRKSPAYRETLVYGSFEPFLEDVHNVIAYMRKTENQTILILSNYQREPRVLPLPAPVRRVLLNNCPDKETESHRVPSDSLSDSISLAGYQTLVLELADV